MYCIPRPHSIIRILSRLRPNFSNRRDIRGHIITDPGKLSHTTLHGQRIPAPHVSLQHNIKMQRSSSNKQPAFLKCGRHTKFGTIFALILLDPAINCSDFCNRVHHFIYAKLAKTGAEDLVPRVPTADYLVHPKTSTFFHTLSFECTSKLCMNFLNHFLVYFHI